MFIGFERSSGPQFFCFGVNLWAVFVWYYDGLMKLIEMRKKIGIAQIGFVSGGYSIVLALCRCDYHVEEESADFSCLAWITFHQTFALSDHILITH